MKRTYFIVKHEDRSGIHWYAHKKGILSTLGVYSLMNIQSGTISYSSADDCEKKLRIKKKKPVVIRVVKC